MKVTGAVFLFFLLASIPVFFLAQSREQIDLFGNIAQLTGLLLAGVSFWNAWDVAKNRTISKAAILIAGAMLIWAIGQMMVTYSELLLHRSPYGTISSIFFVIGNSMCVTAFFYLANHAMKRSNDPVLQRTLRLIIITGMILTVFLLMLDWRFLTDPERGGVLKLLDLLYPLFDLFIIALSILLVRSAKLRNDLLALKGYAFFGSAFLAILFADIMGIDAGFEKILYRALDMVYFSAYFCIAISGIFLARTSKMPVPTPVERTSHP
jgi:hypothetical protein